MEILFGKSKNAQKTRRQILLVSLPLILLGLIHFHYYNKGPSNSNSNQPQPQSISSNNNPILYEREDVPVKVEELENCDVFTGEWIPNPEAPYYTNNTCWAIHEYQNCIKYGRPDLDFIKWRWKPDGCDLPIFNPYQFLDIVRGKSLAFVGDSVGRNQMQSLICMLSRVEYPYDESYSTDENFKRWKYRGYNFTLAIYSSPVLVKMQEVAEGTSLHTGLPSIHLDEFDDKWVTQIEEFDYVIINAGQWFYRPSMYYEKGRIVGCRFCQVENIIDLPMTYGYRKAFRTAFEAINRLENYKGLTILRTYTPSHLEGGEWDKGGDCVRTKPFRSNETILEGSSLDLYLTQIEEFKIAKRKGKKKGLRYRLLDTTQAMLLRPDGHPSRYGHQPQENVTLLYNDCVHWCLPGPIDTWSDFLLDLLKREGRKSRDERLQFQQDKNQSN